MDIHVGDVLKMKKAHPCGSQEWLVLRVGMDFRMRCLGCGHEVMLPGTRRRKVSERCIGTARRSNWRRARQRAAKEEGRGMNQRYWSSRIQGLVPYTPGSSPRTGRSSS